MPTEIERWIFMDGMARRKFGIDRIRDQTSAEFGEDIDRRVVEEIVFDYLLRREFSRKRMKDLELMLELNRKLDERAMMIFGSKRLLIALLDFYEARSSR